jgi:hypothetical protein
MMADPVEIEARREDRKAALAVVTAVVMEDNLSRLPFKTWKRGTTARDRGEWQVAREIASIAAAFVEVLAEERGTSAAEELSRLGLAMARGDL